MTLDLSSHPNRDTDLTQHNTHSYSVLVILEITFSFPSFFLSFCLHFNLLYYDYNKINVPLHYAFPDDCISISRSSDSSI